MLIICMRDNDEGILCDEWLLKSVCCCCCHYCYCCCDRGKNVQKPDPYIAYGGVDAQGKHLD